MNNNVVEAVRINSVCACVYIFGDYPIPILLFGWACWSASEFCWYSGDLCMCLWKQITMLINNPHVVIHRLNLFRCDYCADAISPAYTCSWTLAKKEDFLDAFNTLYKCSTLVCIKFVGLCYAQYCIWRELDENIAFVRIPRIFCGKGIRFPLPYYECMDARLTTQIFIAAQGWLIKR